MMYLDSAADVVEDVAYVAYLIMKSIDRQILTSLLKVARVATTRAFSNAKQADDVHLIRQKMYKDRLADDVQLNVAMISVTEKNTFKKKKALLEMWSRKNLSKGEPLLEKTKPPLGHIPWKKKVLITKRKPSFVVMTKNLRGALQRGWRVKLPSTCVD